MDFFKYFVYLILFIRQNVLFKVSFFLIFKNGSLAGMPSNSRKTPYVTFQAVQLNRGQDTKFNKQQFFI